jgi:hypothetical protein
MNVCGFGCIEMLNLIRSSFQGQEKLGLMREDCSMVTMVMTYEVLLT